MCSPTRWISGFGYVSSLDDYKVVGIIQNHKGCEQFHVFSLKSNTWKKIEFDFDGYILMHHQLVNQTLYWTAHYPYNPLEFDLKAGKMVAFDLALGTFEWFSWTPRSIYIMGGCLSKFSSNSQNDLVIEIVKSSGEVFPVCLSFASSWKDIKCSIGFTKTGKFFVVFRNPRMFGLVDPSSKPPFSLTEDQGIVETNFTAFSN